MESKSPAYSETKQGIFRNDSWLFLCAKNLILLEYVPYK